MTSKYFPYFEPRTASSGPIAELAPDAAERHAQVPVLAQPNITLAEVLSAAGYQTVGLFTNPHHHSTSGFWQGFDFARYLVPDKGSLPYARGSQIHQGFFDWYDNEREDRPYFAYLHFMDVHNPYRPPQFLRKQFVDVKGRDLFINGIPQADKMPTDDDLRYMIALYDAEIRFVDLVMQNLIEDLGERDGLNNTVVIVTSDHGDEFMDHGGLGHGKHLSTEMLHVPMFAVGPGIAAQREKALVRQLDLAPTITELAGLTAPPDYEGASLTPMLWGWPTEEPEVQSSFAWLGHQRSLTTPAWHLTSSLRPGSTRLYDLSQDPGGHRDVAREHPDLVETFMNELSQMEEQRRITAQRSRELARQDDMPDSSLMDTEVREQLKALGYLDD